MFKRSSSQPAVKAASLFSGQNPQRQAPQTRARETQVLETQASETRPRIRSTTVLCVRRNGSVVMAADGQVTLGDSVIKHSAKKIRRLYQDKILAGFAGSTADAFSLFSRFESEARAVCR